MSSYNLYQVSQNTFVPQRAMFNAASGDSNSSKTYHATAEWGKRGMTLQELTRAFDAFNEAEERVAIGFAGSEVRLLHSDVFLLYGSPTAAQHD
jgi:hypothetical protein